jgi:hypothetical protein
MKTRRPRIPAKVIVGQVVASTNPLQYACCRALVVLQSYNSLTYKRISRYVKASE